MSNKTVSVDSSNEDLDDSSIFIKKIGLPQKRLLKSSPSSKKKIKLKTENTPRVSEKKNTLEPVTTYDEKNAQIGLSGEGKKLEKHSKIGEGNVELNNLENKTTQYLCPLCWKKSENNNLHVTHMKQCAKKKKLTTKQLIEVVDLHQRQMKERLDLGLNEVSNSSNVEKLKKKEKPDLTSSYEMSLAVAMSRSLADQNKGTTNTTLDSFGFVSNHQPSTSLPFGRRKGKSLFTCVTKSVLKQRTQSERERIMSEKAAIILLDEDGDSDRQLQHGNVKKILEKAEHASEIELCRRMEADLWSYGTDRVCRDWYVPNLSPVQPEPGPEQQTPTISSCRGPGNLADDWLKFVDNKQFSDVTIETKDGRLVHAHSLVLSVRCPLMLTLDYKRIMSGYNWKSVVCLLRYLYTDRLGDVVDDVTVEESSRLARVFGIDLFKTNADVGQCVADMALGSPVKLEVNVTLSPVKSSPNATQTLNTPVKLESNKTSESFNTPVDETPARLVGLSPLKSDCNETFSIVRENETFVSPVKNELTYDPADESEIFETSFQLDADKTSSPVKQETNKILSREKPDQTFGNMTISPAKSDDKTSSPMKQETNKILSREKPDQTFGNMTISPAKSDDKTSSPMKQETNKILSREKPDQTFGNMTISPAKSDDKTLSYICPNVNMEEMDTVPASGVVEEADTVQAEDDIDLTQSSEEESVGEMNEEEMEKEENIAEMKMIEILERRRNEVEREKELEELELTRCNGEELERIRNLNLSLGENDNPSDVDLFEDKDDNDDCIVISSDTDVSSHSSVVNDTAHDPNFEPPAYDQFDDIYTQSDSCKWSSLILDNSSQSLISGNVRPNLRLSCEKEDQAVKIVTTEEAELNQETDEDEPVLPTQIDQETDQEESVLPTQINEGGPVVSSRTNQVIDETVSPAPSIVSNLNESVFRQFEESFSGNEPVHSSTPVVNNRNVGLLLDYTTTQVTPRPEFTLMKTNSLKKNLTKYGLKKSLSKNKAKKILCHIYDELHPVVNTETGVVVNQQPADAVNKCSNRRKRKKVNDGDDETNSDGDVPTRSDSVCLNFDEEEFDDESGGEMLTQSVKDLPTAFRDYLQQNSSFHTRILMYEPIWIEELQNHLYSSTNKKFKLNDIMDYLDKQCITFRSESQSKNNKRRNERKTVLNKKKKIENKRGS